jgi:hypothetical protein
MKILYKKDFIIYNKLNIITYQEWWRDWPEEAQQPMYYILIHKVLNPAV